MDLEGKTILITGATGGIGSELAKQLAEKKCNIAIFARRENKLKEIAEENKTKETKYIYQKCDVTNEDDVKRAVMHTEETFGKIDVAFLNAGVLIPNPIQTFNSEVITKTMKINFFGTVFFIEQLLTVMKKQEKSVIAITSTLPDRRGLPGWGAYGASKAAISWLAESLRAEAKQKYNIKMITIKPGAVETPMIQDYERKGSISSKDAARVIIKGVEKEKKIIQFPISQVLVTRITDLFPAFAYDMQDIDTLKGDGYPEPSEEKEN